MAPTRSTARRESADLFSLQAASNLISLGALRENRDAAGERQLSLRLDCASLTAALRVSTPNPLRGIGFGRRDIKTFSKLEIVQYLLMRGWKPSADEFLEHNGPKHMNKNAIFMSLAYLRVLVVSQAIFLKPGGLQHIWQHGKEYYYNLLLRLQDLSAVTALSNAGLKALCDADCKVMRAALPAFPLPIEAGLESDPVAEVPEEAAEHALLALPAPPFVPLGAPVAAVPVAEGMQPSEPLEPVIVTVGGLEGQKVYYDHSSHQTAKQRCFTYCKMHANCRQYVFVHNFASREDAVGYLIAWLLAGSTDDSMEAHRDATPAADLAEACTRLQFG